MRCLLASEVVHLMCLVPHFFDLLQTNEGIVITCIGICCVLINRKYIRTQGLIKMTAIATKNFNVSEVIAEIAWKVRTRGVRV